MAEISHIEWTDATWNVARGCSKVDADCKFCYMYRDSFDGTRYTPNTVVRTKGVFSLPLKLKTPSKIFTSSLTDFFHEEIDAYRHEAWDIIKKCPHHTFQILTKRPERIAKCLPSDWGNGYSNVWLGTSVGHQGAVHRIDLLAEVEARIKFVSFEPLHSKIQLMPSQYMSYQWAIIGGESGNESGKYRYRECKEDWIHDLSINTRYHGGAVFIKQLGTYLAKANGLKDRHGRDMSEWPEYLMVRQFPEI